LSLALENLFGGANASHWIKWNTITQSPQRGGIIGTRKPRSVNVAMLGKYL